MTRCVTNTLLTDLSIPESSFIHTAESSFSHQILFFEWACCFLHFLEDEHWRTIAPFRRGILNLSYLPRLHGLIYPWKIHITRGKKKVYSHKSRKTSTLERKPRMSRTRINSIMWLAPPFVPCRNNTERHSWSLEAAQFGYWTDSSDLSRRSSSQSYNKDDSHHKLITYQNFICIKTRNYTMS